MVEAPRGPRRIRVSVCSSSEQSNVQGVIDFINDKMKDVVESVTFVQLPYNIRDMNRLDLKGIDVMVLCHSINNRRFSITDVTDSLYDEFLQKAAKILGRDRVCVIAHDFPDDDITPAKLKARMESFRISQPTTFRLTSLAFVAGNLEKNPPKLTEEQKDQLKNFFLRAAQKPESLLDRLLNCLRDCCMKCFLGLFGPCISGHGGEEV